MSGSDIAPTSLRGRLDEVRARLSHMRFALEAQDDVDERLKSALQGFENEHGEISKSLDTGTTVTEQLHEKATKDTDSLEHALANWVRDLDKKFAGPGKRTPNVSM